MKTLTSLSLRLWSTVLFLFLQGCKEGATESDAMPQSAAWRETTVITVGGSKDVSVSDYVVSNKDWAVTITRKRKTVAGKVDGAIFPKGNADSVEAVSPAATLPFVFSSVERLKKEGKMHPDPHKLSSKQPSKGQLEKAGDTWGIRYDESLSFPVEVAIWRKSGETTVITYSKFRKMDEAASRAEIDRVLAPYSKPK